MQTIVKQHDREEFVDRETSATRGRDARKSVPRNSHAEWSPAPDRRDPVSILQAQAATRVPELVAIRYQRMSESPFSFYRGGAAIMAADLAATADTGLRVQCCGDAHLSNFGGFAAPDRTEIFDVNDFDETLPGPWEWDVKRLAASFAIASQDRGFDDDVGKHAVMETVGTYRRTMRQFTEMRNLEVWYARLDVQGIITRWRKHLSHREMKGIERAATKATQKNSLKAFAKLTKRVDGQVQIVNDPPLIVRLEDLWPTGRGDSISEETQGWIRAYGQTLRPELRDVLATYQVVDVARKVVGVGSVGTRCWIALLLGRDGDDPLFLQIKEADASALEPVLGPSSYPQHGQRVVEGQRRMQSASDIFLGWERTEGLDGVTRDFYVRQLWDGKESMDFTTMPSSFLPIYGRMCGWTLACAHARTRDRVAIAAYLGRSDDFDRAIVKFAFKYANQNARDYDELKGAERAGQIPVETSSVGSA
jgi:uncharacterized protein (DUF2252 family)